MKRRALGFITAAALTTSMVSTAAFADAGTLSITGDINYSGVEASVDVDMIVDTDAGTQSLNGSVSVSGVDFNVSEYWDSEQIMFAVPFVSKVLSYNYRTEPTGAIASMLPAEGIAGINSYISMLYDNCFNPTDYTAYIEGITTAVTNAFTGIEPTQLEAKECVSGDGTISCEGIEVVVGGSTLADLYDEILDVSDENGVSIRDRIESMSGMYKGLAAVSNDESAIEETARTFDQMLNAHDTIASLSDITIDVYMAESYPAEVDVTYDDSTLGIALQGDSDAPWSKIVITGDGEELAAIALDVSAEGGSATLTMNGEEVGSLEVGITENGGNASLIVNGEEMAAASLTLGENNGALDIVIEGETTITLKGSMNDGNIEASALYNGEEVAVFTTSGNAYTLDIPAAGLTIDGEILDNGLTANIGDIAHFTITASDGGTPVVPEGDVLDLGSASTDDLNAVVNEISSLFGGSSADSAA